MMMGKCYDVIMWVSAGRRFSGLLLLLGIAVSSFGKQSGDDGSKARIAIPKSLTQYLSLSGEQAAALENSLQQYREIVESKQANQQAVQMRATVDRSINANRALERDQTEIEKARSDERAFITGILSSDQLSRLERLAAVPSGHEDSELAKLAEQAASLNLIKRCSLTPNQPFGGAVAIFAADTASQPALGKRVVNRKPLAKRPPPSFPPP